MTDVTTTIRDLCARAREASFLMSMADGTSKNRALTLMAKGLRDGAERIKAENAADVEAGIAKGLSAAMVDRLLLDDARIEQMAKGIEEVVALPDPIGGIDNMTVRPNGLRVGKMRIPLGVIGIIYESRPNVTADAACLCVKAGNATVLRGGSEAIRSNAAIAAILREALSDAGLPEDAVSFIDVTDRSAIDALLVQEEFVDLIIPRGGEGLIRSVVEKSRIPVIKHYKGVCHLYVDAGADLAMAVDLTVNAKTQRPGVCNALETLLVHRDEAAEFLPRIAHALSAKGVELRACDESMPFMPGSKAAMESDWPAEYLDLIISVKIVPSFDDAVAHIRRYGSLHTEAIVTRDHTRAMRFVREVDSSLVLVNASTRFNDGFQLGLGAEIGISTTKLHAFGPMGLTELTTTKFVAFGDGQVRV